VVQHTKVALTLTAASDILSIVTFEEMANSHLPVIAGNYTIIPKFENIPRFISHLKTRAQPCLKIHIYIYIKKYLR